MLIRPDDIIHNDSSMKKARILEKQFRGAEFLYKLLYNNEHQILCYAPSHHDHEIGESIGIELDIEHYVILRDNEKIIQNFQEKLLKASRGLQVELC